MTDRIPCTPDTKIRVRQFKKGLGITYDDAVNFLLDNLVKPNEDELEAGIRLRDKVPREMFNTNGDTADQ